MSKSVLREQLRKILFAFDLDDTLIKTQSNIIVRNGDQVRTLSPAEYAIYEPQPGDEFDYSEFKGLTKPEIIKDTFELFSKILKSTGKLANAETIILTARTPSITSDLQKFLDSQGLPGVKLYAVGSSDPEKKAEVIQKFIDQGYDTIRFYDDSPKNVAAVKALNSTNPEVDVQAKLIKHIMAEIIRKVNNKYAVYPKKGGKRLGTHSTRAAAEKQLAAIHINKEAVEETFPFQIKDKQFDEEDNSLISVDYTFDTPTKTYRVVLNSGEYGPEDGIFDLSFGVDKGDFNKIDTFQMTGEGSVRKVISTIVKIIEDFINKFDVNKVKASATTEKRQRVYKALFSKLPSPLSDKVEINEVIEPADPSEVDPKELKMGIRVEMEHTDDPKEAQHIALQHLAEDPKYYSKLATLNLEGEHDPMNPGILKKRLGKLSCTKVRKERAKLKDKGTTYAKALQRYLNYHCQ